MINIKVKPENLYRDILALFGVWLIIYAVGMGLILVLNNIIHIPSLILLFLVGIIFVGIIFVVGSHQKYKELKRRQSK